MKKNTVRIIVDSLMLVIFVLLFKKSAISLTFHEAVGLAVCAVFILHLIINYKWIVGVTKKLFSKTTPAKTRIGYLVDFILCVCFLGILISGIDCSKRLFPKFPVLNSKATPLHFFFGAVMLICVGIHLGLHWNWIKGILTNHGKWNSKIYSSIRSILIVLLSGFGVYSIATSNMAMWLKAPFSSSANAMHGAGGGGRPPVIEAVPLSTTIYNCLYLILQFVSIAILIAFVVVMIEKIILYFRNKKQASL